MCARLSLECQEHFPIGMFVVRLGVLANFCSCAVPTIAGGNMFFEFFFYKNGCVWILVLGPNTPPSYIPNLGLNAQVQTLKK